MEQKLSRRAVIAGAAIVPLSALEVRAQSVPSTLSATERHILEAFMDRLVPKDELGPGAVECGAANYVDQQLAGALAAEKTSFIAGLAAIESLAQRTGQMPFAALSPYHRDLIITAMENGTAEGFPNARAVFARIRRLTLEGMFSDPHYGGNRNFAGWDMIRYPGPRVAVGPAEQSMTGEIKPYRKSAWPAAGNNGTGGDHGR